MHVACKPHHVCDAALQPECRESKVGASAAGVGSLRGRACCRVTRLCCHHSCNTLTVATGRQADRQAGGQADRAGTHPGELRVCHPAAQAPPKHFSSNVHHSPGAALACVHLQLKPLQSGLRLLPLLLLFAACCCLCWLPAQQAQAGQHGAGVGARGRPRHARANQVVQRINRLQVSETGGRRQDVRMLGSCKWAAAAPWPRLTL